MTNASIAVGSGGQLIAGTESGQLRGWRLQPAAMADSPTAANEAELTQVEHQQELTAAPASTQPETHEPGMNGFAKKPPAQKLAQKPGRLPLESASSTSSSLSARQNRQARSLARVRPVG